MKTLIKKITDLKESLGSIQNIFIGNPHLDKLDIEYYAAEDGGDVNVYFTKVTINDAEYHFQDGDDNIILELSEIEDGILSEVELEILEGSLVELLEFSSEQDLETITFIRETILELNIKAL